MQTLTYTHTHPELRSIGCAIGPVWLAPLGGDDLGMHRDMLGLPEWRRGQFVVIAERMRQPPIIGGLDDAAQVGEARRPARFAADHLGGGHQRRRISGSSCAQLEWHSAA